VPMLPVTLQDRRLASFPELPRTDAQMAGVHTRVWGLARQEGHPRTRDFSDLAAFSHKTGVILGPGFGCDLLFDRSSMPSRAPPIPYASRWIGYSSFAGQCRRRKMSGERFGRLLGSFAHRYRFCIGDPRRREPAAMLAEDGPQHTAAIAERA
jgi:hypothetical protein